MKKRYPKVSIITPAFRAEYFIKEVIANFSKIKYPNIEFLLIFDPSPDKGFETAKALTKGQKNWRVISNKRHLGISKTLNLGIKNSRGKYVGFFMTDMAVDSNCLTELVSFLEKAESSVGVAVAKTFDFHHRDRIQAYRMYFVPQTGYLHIPEYGFKDSRVTNLPFEGFSGIDGAIFKKEVFKKTGAFDVDVDMGINDLDLIWRVWLAGFKVVRVPTAKVYHWSLKEGRATDRWEFSYARMIDLFIQNYSLKYLVIYLPQLIVVFSARALITLMEGNPSPMRGWLQSLKWSVSYLPKALKKRRYIQSKVRAVSDDYLRDRIFSPMSLWEFYSYVRWVQKNITPKMLTKEANYEKILTFSK